MAGTTVQVGNNKKYPDVPLFYGNGDDREKWEGWRLHLESKFRQSAVLYTCEQDKICDDPYVSYDAYQIYFDTTLFSTHFRMICCHMRRPLVWVEAYIFPHFCT